MRILFLTILAVGMGLITACGSNNGKSKETFAESLIPLAINKDITCTYQRYLGMFYAKGELESYSSKNNKPLEWSFLNLKAQVPEYLSGGDRGRLLKIPHTHDDGVTLMVPQGTGAHIFTIWPNGISMWSKHNNLVENYGSQAFIGVCENIRNR